MILGAQPVDDAQLPADIPAGQWLLDIVAGMDGHKEMVECRLEVTGVESLHRSGIFYVSLRIRKRLGELFLVVEAMGKL